MQANANFSTARKQWCVWHFPNGNCAVRVNIHISKVLTWAATVNITGASPAYVEALVEELNIRANEMLYNLGRISRE